jgi:hypothetical protein
MPGATVHISACYSFGVPFSPLDGQVPLVDDPPGVITLESDKEPANRCGGYFVTGINPGTAFLLASDGGKVFTAATIVVFDCQDYPRVGPSQRVIKAVAGELAEMRPNPETSQPFIAAYTWYEGPLGDRAHPIKNWFFPYRIFTPPEAKQYRFWVEISERCGTKSVEYVIDATAAVPRRRAVRR